jgi:hypothetical protein
LGRPNDIHGISSSLSPDVLIVFVKVDDILGQKRVFPEGGLFTMQLYLIQ